jgi:hypothetical protein
MLLIRKRNGNPYTGGTVHVLGEGHSRSAWMALCGSHIRRVRGYPFEQDEPPHRTEIGCQKCKRLVAGRDDD